MRPIRSKRAAAIAAVTLAGGTLAALAGLHAGPFAPAPSNAATMTVPAGGTLGNFFFCDKSFHNQICETKVNVGDTVTWDFSNTGGIAHTSTECTGLCGSPIPAGQLASRVWHSGASASGMYSFTFDTPGTYQYQCNIHPTEMRGRIVVNGGAQTPPAFLVGDVNCSGGTDSIDAALVLQLSAGLVNSLSCQQNADANGDGAINSIDAALILQFGAGLIDQLPP